MSSRKNVGLDVNVDVKGVALDVALCRFLFAGQYEPFPWKKGEIQQTNRRSTDKEIGNSHRQYQPDIKPEYEDQKGESETSHHTPEMNAKHKDGTFFALTATMSCAA